MRTPIALVLFALVAGGTGVAQQRPAGARNMFYDPAWGQVFELTAAQSAPLRRVKPPGGNLQYVGIHYWFEAPDHQSVTAFQAATRGGIFTLHIRTNVPGFMGIWSASGQRLQMKPEVISEYSANKVVPEQSYAVTGDLQFSPSARSTSLFVVFSRSETETVKTVADALDKLDTVVTYGGRNGLPALVHETEGGLAGQIGTYVVNQGGGVVATEIIISPTLAQSPPDDFAVRFEFGVCTTDVFDTFKGVFVRDMGPEQPSVTVDVSLAPEVRNAIYQAVVDARFFEYPEEFNPRTAIGVAPAEHYQLLIRNGGLSHHVHWVDSARASTEEATRLRALVRRIGQYVFGLPEVAKLARAPTLCA